MIDFLLSQGLLPDRLIRAGIRRQLRDRLAEIAAPDEATRRRRLDAFATALRAMPVALETAAANGQHYEVPAAFYGKVLGPRLKYSCAFYRDDSTTLAEAEEAMLALTCEEAEIRDAQDILELGCGWGSLTLWMAEKYPAARITGVSNSHSQREYIEGECRRRGLKNVTILTRDMNVFEAGAEHFDRVVSVEMFEHMKNWPELLRRIADWLRPGGKLFVHIFTHRAASYHFVARDESDWMAKHFFTGGMMPAADLLPMFDEHLRPESRRVFEGTHYARTAADWLKNMDARRAEIMPVFRETYGRDAVRLWHYWRVFFMACEELWRHDAGREWPVCHYRFAKP